ncbi:hypothetical protein [Sphingomonas paucimobilis]|uniref:hypothetical protein n=1 Tax=Sphingomonas paucimobilis TaxID=13689 RepID=UPI002041C4CF|nr:hypothetical protein [Sphingomonas paucimobilis]MCM3680964.1 hypothetical protein [Sphingomonas paucimobilis]
MTDPRANAIAVEARRQEESCLYTSTSLYLWLRQVRRQKQIFVIVPIILGAVAGFSAFKEHVPAVLVASLTLIASLFPALADALKITTSVDEITASAATFKALQDRFRRLATITILSDIDAAETALGELMDRMDVARSNSITPPERYFTAAQAKIKSGDYDFSVDLESPTNILPRV